MYVASYIDGVQTSGPFPSMADYSFEYAECNNNAVLNFDLINWKATVTDLTEAKTKCNLYFKSRSKYSNMIYEMMVNLAQTDTTNFAYDEAGNIRYIGTAPYNYVTFNEEIAGWRIIGAFKDIDDGLGRTEWRIKIIRNKITGNSAWDIDSANSNGGINEWSTSDLKSYLNDVYYPGLSQEAKNMIGNAVWNLGTNGNSNYTTATPRIFYDFERSNNTGKICTLGTECNDTVPRTTKWTGKIGLMYPSDYGYATGENTRSTCLNTSLSSWNNNANCYNNDWLFLQGNMQWTMTPFAHTTYGSTVFPVDAAGNISDYSLASHTRTVRPTLYLSSNVYITGGSGTSTDPYTLGLQ